MKSVHNTFEVLEVIAAHGPISLQDMSERIEFPKSTTQRCIKTLKDYGWIKAESPTGNPKWILSNQFLSLTPTNHLVSDLHRIAKPYLYNIRDYCNETTFLSTYDTNVMTVIEFVDSLHPVRLVGGMGSRIPAHNSSTGRACLALLSGEALTKVLPNPILAVDQTPIDLSSFEKELKRIKKQGYARVDKDWSSELIHLGCAITDSKSNPIGGLCVSIPKHRHENIDEPKLINELITACHDISTNLYSSANTHA